MTDAEKMAQVKELLDLREQGKISAAAVVIGLVLIENAGAGGHCSLSRADIGARAGIERIPTVSAKITELRKSGFMDVQWHCRINNYYLPRQETCAPATPKCNGKRYASTRAKDFTERGF